MAPRSASPSRRWLAVAVAGTAIALAACGGDDSAGTAARDGAAEAPADAVAAGQVPDVEVRDVHTGDAVDLAELAAGRDTLLWFWAPH